MLPGIEVIFDKIKLKYILLKWGQVILILHKNGYYIRIIDLDVLRGFITLLDRIASASVVRINQYQSYYLDGIQLANI